MKKLLQVSILVLLAVMWVMIGLSYAACTGSSPTWTTTPDRTSFATCVSSASRGDTINVSAGTETWTSTVTVTKALTIQGAGYGSTIIKNGQSGAYYMLSFSPTAPNLDVNYQMKITGITWDAQFQAYGIRFLNRSATYPLTVVLGDNYFKNGWDGGKTTGDPMSPIVSFYGRFVGVVYENLFDRFPYILNDADGVTNFNYSTFNVTHGSADFMYYEDNTIKGDGVVNYTGWEPFIIPNSNGARVVMRWNDFLSYRTATNHSKPWSPHHPTGGVAVGGKGGEFYGNLIRHDAGNAYWLWGTPRAGKNIMLYNRIYSSSCSLQWTMYNPTSYRPATTNYACPSGVYAPWVGQYYCDPAGQPQHIVNSYLGPTFCGNTGAGSLSSVSVSDGGRLTEDVHYFNYESSFDGSTGVGCGTYAAMTAITPTTTGVGFWVPNATIDPTAASCSNVNSWVGRNNTLAASVGGKIGKLYRWSGSAWVLHFEPYAYPHPLRGPDEIKPTNVLTSVCSGEDCATPLACEGGSCTVVITVTASDNVAVSGVKACLENGTTCVTGTSYANMGLSFVNTSGSTWVLTLEDVEDDGSFAYNIKSIDSSGNESENLIAAFDTESNSDITNPTLDTVVLASDGMTLALTFSEAIKDGGTYANSQWNFTVDGMPMSITCIESWNADTLTCTTASCVDADDEGSPALLLDWNQPVTDDSIADIAGNPLADISDKSVTNNSGMTCGTPPSGTSLFSHDETPPVTSVLGSAGNYGLQFSSTSGGYITHGWFYKHADMDGQTHTFSLWDSSGNELARKVFSGETGSGWQSIELDSSIPILPDTTYTIAINLTGGQYARSANYFAQAYTSSTFTIPFAGGRHALTSPITYPTTGTTSNFWIDFTFVPTGSSTWTVAIDNGSAAGYKCNLPAARIVDNGNATEVEVEVANGWKATFSGCGAGSTVQSGNQYTHTTAAITENCTVEVICEQRRSPLWLIP